MFPKLITSLSSCLPFSIFHLVPTVPLPLVLADSGPTGLGCFTDDPFYANLTGGGAFDVNGAIADFCRRTTETIFYPYDARGGCYNFADNLCLDMSIGNLNGSWMVTLGTRECQGHFLNELSWCHQGSRQVYGHFEVYIDPNVGKCPGSETEA